MNKSILLSIMILAIIALPVNLTTQVQSMHPNNKCLNQKINPAFTFTFKDNIVRPVPIKIVFVNFAERLIDLNMIKSRLLYFNNMEYGYGRAKYVLNYTLEFANTELNRTIIEYIEQNKKQDNTSDLLESVLQEQADLVNNGTLGVRRKIFENNITGYSIDAVKFEEFLANISDTKRTFYIYVLNLSYMDNHALNKEHWFTVNEKNIDSNRTRDFWRLEWDNNLNKDVKFPYAGFNAKTRIFFIDPSAYNWYLTWARIWWGGIYNDSLYGRYFYDLDHFVSKLNLSDSNDLKDLNTYLIGWLNDIIDDLFASALSVNLAGGELYSRTASVQIKVVNLRPDVIPTESLEWTVHPKYIERAFKDVYSDMNLDINIEFHDADDYPQIINILNNNIYRVNESNGWVYYDGIGIFSSLLSYNDEYFDQNKAEKTLTGWIFILYNASMYVYGKEFTGLGGKGHIMIMMDIHRIMGDNLDSPKQGFTSIIIHELGHAVGAMHTFSRGSHASDFAFDVMGYYPASWNFSTIRKNTMLREIGDFRLLKAYHQLELILSNVNVSTLPSELLNLTSRIFEQLNEIDKYMNETKYIEGNSMLTEVERDIITLEKAFNDTITPSITILEPINGSHFNTTNITLVLNVRDNVGISKIKVYLNEQLVYEGTEETINITLSNSCVNTIRVEAYDFAGNMASAEVIVYYGSCTNVNVSDYVFWIEVTMLIGSIAIIVTLVFVYKTSKKNG